MPGIHFSHTHTQNLLVGKESHKRFPDGGAKEVEAGEEGAQADPVAHQIPLQERKGKRLS